MFLVHSLNRIIQGPLIYRAQRFAKVKLSEDACKLLAQVGDGRLRVLSEEAELLESEWEFRETKIFQLNRILLEDAYPGEIRRAQTDRWQACEYLSQKLAVCIGEIVDPGETMKEWFQNVASQISKAGSSIRWTAPSGFPVYQETWMLESDPVDVGGKELVLWRKPEEGAVRDTGAQVRKIVANVIHSLDAAHMVLTIRRLSSEGLKHFGVVHDCYAVHACDVDELHRALREEFVTMYRIPEGGKSVLGKFLAEQEELTKDLKLKFPALPPPGDFDIEQVLESKYFFC